MKINVEKVIASIVSSRDAIQKLLEQYYFTEEVILDFQHVEFISRSVADELVHQKEKRNIRFIHLNASIEEMINLVSKRKKSTHLPSRVKEILFSELLHA